MRKQSWGPGAARFAFAVLVGFVFLLPHLVRIAKLGSYRSYTPFAAASPSPMEWDETFLYGPETNFVLTRHALGGDTDTWEHRNDVFPYSVLPIGVEAGIALVSGGLENAQLICHFAFPAISAWLLIGLFRRTGANLPLAAALSLAVLSVGFSAQTVVRGDLALLEHRVVMDTMQGARTPNPSMSFPLYLGAVICLCAAIRRRSTRMMILAGALGGLLFYSYMYYAIGWSAALVLLATLAMLGWAEIPENVTWALAAAVVTAGPFLWWKHLSVSSGAYGIRATRLGLTLGHKPTVHGVELTLAWGIFGLLLVIAWRWLRSRRQAEDSYLAYANVLMTVLACCLAGGLAGLNMQLVTGFNIQAEHHFPHMVLQPVGMIMLCLLVVVAWQRWLRRGVVLGSGLFAVLFLACCGAQIVAGENTAEIHRVRVADAELFHWLTENTAVGSVVATTDLQLATVLPLYTHNSTLLAEGSRTAASNGELVERFLLASALSGTPAQVVEHELSQGSEDADRPLPLVTPTYYLFEVAPEYVDTGHRRMTQSALNSTMRQYGAMNLGNELKRFRVDYVWMKDGSPVAGAGWRWKPVLTTADGTLWQIERYG